MTGQHAGAPGRGAAPGGDAVRDGAHPGAPTPDGADPGSSAQGRPAHGAAFRPWRLATPLMLLASGALFVISGANAEGTDLRPGRYSDLASLAQAESDGYDGVRDDIATLNDDIEALSEGVDDREVAQLRRKVERLEPSAGLREVRGAGVTITMSDASADRVDGAEELGYDLNRLVVHQQDLQAVVNTLWQGGAQAVTIQGQRIVTTTGIKCEGNAVQLQGRPYPQPYVIEAVGDPAQLAASVEADPDVSSYRTDSANPVLAVGWDFEIEDEIEAPAYDGLLDLGYAVPLR